MNQSSNNQVPNYSDDLIAAGEALTKQTAVPSDIELQPLDGSGPKVTDEQQAINDKALQSLGRL